jgi:arginyl-tRNA synthetase
MRLETLLNDITEEMYKKIVDNRSIKEADAHKTAQMVALSAIKYGDLSNQAAKDYIFDTERFTSFEGDTGPYILYTIVRIKSILNRYTENGGDTKEGTILAPAGDSEKALMLCLTDFNATVETAFAEKAPHKICSYIYGLANAFNHFYHETKILSEEDTPRRQSYIRLLELTRDVLETSVHLLGFSAPDKM